MSRKFNPDQCPYCERYRGVFTAPDLSSEYILTCMEIKSNGMPSMFSEGFEGETSTICPDHIPLTEATIKSREYTKKVFTWTMDILNKMSDEEFVKLIENKEEKVLDYYQCFNCKTVSSSLDWNRATNVEYPNNIAELPKDYIPNNHTCETVGLSDSNIDLPAFVCPHCGSKPLADELILVKNK
jgi:rubrerythrin